MDIIYLTKSVLHRRFKLVEEIIKGNDHNLQKQVNTNDDYDSRGEINAFQ